MFIVSTVHNSQNLKRTHGYKIRQLDKETTVHTHNGILLGLRKDEITQFAMWIDLESTMLSEARRGQTKNGLSYMKEIKKHSKITNAHYYYYCSCCCHFFFFFLVTHSQAQRFLLALPSGITPVCAEGGELYGLLGLKPGPDACKVNTLPTGSSLWPRVLLLQKLRTGPQ